MHREIISFVLAPLASGVLQGIVMGNYGAALFGAMLAYPLSIFCGVPTFFVFRSKGWLKLWQVALAGLVLGLSVGVLIGLIIGYENYWASSVINGYFLLGLHGLVVAVSFWLMAYAGVGSNKSLKERDALKRAP